MTELLVVVDVVVREPVVEPSRTAVPTMSVGVYVMPLVRFELHDIFEQREDRHRMLEAGVAVLHEREVHREVRPALGGGREAQLLRRHDHPLPHFAIAGQVLLDRLRVVVIGVAAHDVARFVETLDVVLREDAGAGGVEARADQRAGLHQVGVGENVGRRRLRIALRRDAVRETRHELRDLIAVHAPAEPVVRVNVDEAGNDRLAADVDHPSRPSGIFTEPLRADRRRCDCR